MRRIACGRAARAAAGVALLAGCGSDPAGPPAGAGSPPPMVGSVDCGAFLVSGDPRSTSGATWTYRSTDDGVEYRLEGLLLVPAGDGPFGAVVVSHGKGGLPVHYSASVGRTLVSWGLVVIATRYTHAADNDGHNATLLPAGADGASEANVLRARKTRGLLACVGAADTGRVAAHGHSMGAFVTAQWAGTHAGDLRAASHTAGGTSTGPNATQPAAAARIVTPYQIHHGDADAVVPLAADQALAAVLAANAVPHELHVYAGFSHERMASDAGMLARVREWYRTYGVLP
jgi:dienelactone hydrolase